MVVKVLLQVFEAIAVRALTIVIWPPFAIWVVWCIVGRTILTMGMLQCLWVLCRIVVSVEP